MTILNRVKHQEKKKLKQEIKALSTQLKIALPTLVYSTLLHRINFAVKSRIKSIAKRQERKLLKFRKHQQKSDIKRRIKVSKMSYTIFRHTHYQKMKLWHLIMDWIGSTHTIHGKL